MQTTLAVIPARLGSTRFPRKVLHPLRGKPLVWHVWEKVHRAKTISQIVIATDSPEIEKVARGFGAEVVRTSSRCKTGSDRAAEVLAKVGGDIVVNIQADNLRISPPSLDMVVKKMRRDMSIQFATLARAAKSDEELFDPGRVKVVINSKGQALWFSRFPIPFLQNPRDGQRKRQYPFLIHVGIYFFRATALRQYASWQRTPCEKVESLEQLRVLEQGGAIRVFMTRMNSITVDSPADLRRLSGVGR
jgi:3-deoxy-manno-octulosonate cytidylyltransferase (CMP-KDO synthetase)